ncbi:phospholipid-translocating ATPase rsb1 [Neonectria magnoliae]|uniref:Phospholipid-translocating ATPase rsb1 n=1 Tax=Neonectria magnoliae TaxID=2732573 RepID=A0ABR1I7T8_9HYPO
MTMDAPSLVPNAFYLACHAVLLLPQVFLGIRCKTWGFLFGMFCGHVLEIVGYAARVQMHNGNGGFLPYIVTLTIGPAFFSAAIYLCLARIISVYGENLSRFSPRTYTITFMVSDLVALVLQASGGAILGGDNTSKSTLDAGLAIIKTGLAAHLVSIAIFIALAAEYGFRAYRHQNEWSYKFSDLQKSRKFFIFLIGITAATVFILIRTSFRMAELQNGFDSKLANNETAFIALEGGAILIATLCLAISHPGVAFQGRWGEADFQLRKNDKARDLQKTEYDRVQLSSV